MGIGGHMLGEKKLRRLRLLTCLELDRAYIRNKHCEGRSIEEDGRCQHYEINLDTGDYRIEDNPIHWSSCPKEN